MIKKYSLGILFLLGLMYILYPGPNSIYDFPPIPNSLKSTEEGDTVQISNVAAYYSFWRRPEITNLYKKQYELINFWPLIFPSIKLNHPPEFSFTYVRDQLKSTFLEEYTYPLRDSLFVSGFDQKIYNDLQYIPHSFYSDTIHQDGVFYNSKTTLRFYPSSIFARIIVYLTLWILAIKLVKISKLNLKVYR